MDTLNLMTFRGGGQYSVDDKGRVVVPRQFRLNSGDQLVVTRGLERCLYAYPVVTWAAMVEAPLGAAERFDPDAVRMVRYLFGEASDTTVDQQWRIQISQELRSFANLKTNGDCKVLGCGRWIEIWNIERYEEFLAQTGKEDMRPIAQRVWSHESSAAHAGDAA